MTARNARPAQSARRALPGASTQPPLPHPTARGRFVTLEGPDGSGKSTQALRLSEALRALGWSVCLTREPGGTAVGERIRTVLLDVPDARHTALTDALLFNAARAQLVAEVILPALERGEAVVCDRYADSTLAYQGAGGGVDRMLLDSLQRASTGGLLPDVTVLLDLPIEAGLRRRSRGPDVEWTRFEGGAGFDRAFHERVRAGYLELAAADPGRWRVVDADRDPGAVAVDVLAAVGGALPALAEGRNRR